MLGSCGDFGYETIRDVWVGSLGASHANFLWVCHKVELGHNTV